MNIISRFKFILSDKIILIIFGFSTIFVVLVKFVFGGSAEQILILGNMVYSLALATTYLVSRNFSKRIMDLTFKVEAMAAGSFSKKLESKSKDEIGQLIQALNELMMRVQSGVALDVSKHMELSQAKTDFITIASHQLRTPLCIIKWYIDFLLNDDFENLSPGQLKYLREVYKSNERLIELVNALLDVSRIDLGTFSIEPEPISVTERADLALERFLPEIEKKKIKIEKNYDELPKINLDPRLMKVVFENILSNSIKYTQESGIVRVDIRKTEKDVFIKISDNGCGIPREQQPKIFTKLFRADNVKKIESVGTGLGLYIVKAIIEKSGGKIWFESPSLELLLEHEKKSDKLLGKGNGGTTFFITIPLKGMKRKAGTKKLVSF